MQDASAFELWLRRLIPNPNSKILSSSEAAVAADPLQFSDSGALFPLKNPTSFSDRFSIDFGLHFGSVLASKIDLGARFFQLRFLIDFSLDF